MNIRILLFLNDGESQSVFDCMASTVGWNKTILFINANHPSNSKEIKLKRLNYIYDNHGK